MKRKLFIPLYVVFAVALISCKNKKEESSIIQTEESTKQGDENSEFQEVSIKSNDIILDIKETYTISGRGAAAKGLIIADSIPVGTKVQIIGIDKPLLESTIVGLENDRKLKDYALAGQEVGVVLEKIELDALKGYQRIVVAKENKETDLREAKVFDDVLGQFNENTGIYQNATFGFTMQVNVPNFEARLNPQEGFKVSFQNPASFRDADVFSVNEKEGGYRISFCISSIQGITNKTASKELEYEYSQYKVTPVEKLLDDKQVSYVQIKYEDGRTMDVYAMFVNGYYLKWQVSYSDENSTAKKNLDAIMNTINFDWARK